MNCVFFNTLLLLQSELSVIIISLITIDDDDDGDECLIHLKADGDQFSIILLSPLQQTNKQPLSLVYTWADSLVTYFLFLCVGVGVVHPVHQSVHILARN